MLINILKAVILFGLLGPVVGLLTSWIPAVVTTGQWDLRSLALAVPFAYWFGFIPAICCGLFLGVFRSRLRGVWGYLIAAVAGAVCSASYYLLFYAPDIPDLNRSSAFVIAGFTAGLVCGFAFLRPPPNNSFKPKPLRGSA
jgi:hypothetical protein